MLLETAIIQAMVMEESQSGNGLTAREAENLGVKFNIPRRLARDIFNRLCVQKIIVKKKKRFTNGKGEWEWVINRKLLTSPAGSSKAAK